MNASGMSFQELAVKMEHDMAVMDTIESLPPLQELVGQSADFDTRKANHLAPVGRTEATNNVRKVEPGVMQFAADGKLLIGESLAQVQPYGVTDHGWTQFCGKLGEALTGKGTSLHRNTFQTGASHKNPAIRASFTETLNTLMAEASGSVWLIRTYEDLARAFMSPSYAEVDNSDLLRVLAESLMLQGQKGLNLSDIQFTKHSMVTPDDLHTQVVLKGLDPRDELNPDQDRWQGFGGAPGGMPYGVGVRVTNNETGRRGITVAGIVKRTSCDNSIRVGESTTIRHRGSAAALLYQVTVAMHSALKVGMEGLDRLMKVRMVEIPNVFAEIDHLAEKYEWSTDTTNQVRKGTEGQNNLYGLVNGISSVPANAKLPIDTVMEFEDLAGELLITPESVFAPREHAWVRGANMARVE
jgi:hypothetical protein